ncbi:hypothetical protein [Bradyrhizobium sp. B117]|uniref:hypothetical protein n=1 Tax=Bradyrhizobium sp. B117 TaxID=3140246 RepID=UPI003183631D
MNAQDKERIPKFIHHFQTPFTTGHEIAIGTLQGLAGHHRGLLPSRALIGQLFTGLIDDGAMVGNMKKIAGHAA